MHDLRYLLGLVQERKLRLDRSNNMYNLLRSTRNHHYRLLVELQLPPWSYFIEVMAFDKAASQGRAELQMSDGQATMVSGFYASSLTFVAQVLCTVTI